MPASQHRLAAPPAMGLFDGLFGESDAQREAKDRAFEAQQALAFYGWSTCFAYMRMRYGHCGSWSISSRLRERALLEAHAMVTFQVCLPKLVSQEILARRRNPGKNTKYLQDIEERRRRESANFSEY
eukprot:4624393-Pleurochrysis_carterae.AAC.1